MTHKTSKRRSPKRPGLGGGRRIIHTMLVQTLRPSPAGWEKWVVPIYRNHPNMQDDETEPPKIAILLRGWPRASTAWLAAGLREQLLAKTETLPMNESQSIGIDYFGYDENPYRKYRSWFGVNLLTHPEVTARNSEIMWFWTMDTVLGAIHRLAAKPKVLAPAKDRIAREAAQKWRTKVSVWPDEDRRKMDR